MIYGVYSIRDVKTGFMTPTVELNDDAAARNFYHAVTHSDGILFTYASDFSLYHLAYFDTERGSFQPLDLPVLIAQGSDAVARLAAASGGDQRVSS